MHIHVDTQIGMCQNCGLPLNPRDVLSTGQARWCSNCAEKHANVDNAPASAKSGDRQDLASTGSRSRLSGYVPYIPPADMGSLRRWWQNLSSEEQQALWSKLTVPLWMAQCSATRLLADMLLESRGPNLSVPGFRWLQIAHEYWFQQRAGLAEASALEPPAS